MKTYSVKVTSQAQDHILEYASYIKDELMNSVAAENFVRVLWEEINTLDVMPKRCPCIKEEPWRSMKIRKIIVRGYYVYYLVDDEKKQVIVVGVVYGKRNQIEQLENIIAK